ncbi:2'-5' RNA ligase family protein [Streptomyces griseoviridis]|uniref:2'-5' RNA ligase family protein n=1 Tax=Streptomyces griseoviridis TaxID=45398 RepID=UPI00344DC769
MTDTSNSRGFRPGLSGLVVPVPEADPVVGAVRDRLDRHARTGVPAHVTVLFPFLDASLLDDGTLAELARTFRGHPAFEARFERFGRFPGLLHLAPEPDAPFRALTAAVTARWPEVLPYGGKFGDSAPHLTLAQGQSDAVLDAAEAEVRDGLPVVTRVASVDLVVHDGTAWRHHTAFPLEGPTAGPSAAW